MESTDGKQRGAARTASSWVFTEQKREEGGEEGRRPIKAPEELRAARRHTTLLAGQGCDFAFLQKSFRAAW